MGITFKVYKDFWTLDEVYTIKDKEALECDRDELKMCFYEDYVK